ncbi:MAG: HD domain-containing protein, partial [Chloroflexi bacterium]
LVRELFADAGLAECAQYLLGIVGVLAVRQAAWALPMLALPAAVVYYAFKTNKEMHSSTRLLLENMSDSVDMRDPYTGGHSRRVAELCGRILREMNISGVEANLILSAARVHDIGKMGLPDAILLKAGALTPAEHALLRTHAAGGAELLARYPDFARGASVSSRALGWQGLPGRVEGLRHSIWQSRDCRRRWLRRHDLGPAVPSQFGFSASVWRPARRARPAVGPGRGGCVSARAGATRRATAQRTHARGLGESPRQRISRTRQFCSL